MLVNIIKNAGMICLSILLFTACTPKDVTVYQQEDELLNCKKLTGKIAKLMYTNQQINENTGLEKSSLAMWYLFPPAGVVNQIDASVGRDKIDDRFNYLLELKERQNCEFTDKERAFAKLKGKGRFSEDFEQWRIDQEKRTREMEER